MAFLTAQSRADNSPAQTRSLKCVSDYQDDRERLPTDGYTSTTTTGEVHVGVAKQSSFKHVTCEVHVWCSPRADLGVLFYFLWKTGGGEVGSPGSSSWEGTLHNETARGAL